MSIDFSPSVAANLFGPNKGSSSPSMLHLEEVCGSTKSLWSPSLGYLGSIGIVFVLFLVLYSNQIILRSGCAETILSRSYLTILY